MGKCKNKVLKLFLTESNESFERILGWNELWIVILIYKLCV
jgi:hypothetical protein